MNQSNSWSRYPKQNSISEKVSGLLNISPLISQILLNRSVKNINEAKSFINGTWKQWDMLPNQKQFISIISELILNQSTICIYGDYDADGVTSTAMMVSILRSQGCHVDFISPHRIHDGYGLNKHRIDEIIRKKYDALITLDCGITCCEEIKWLKSARPDVKVIIVDHHKCPKKLPDADVIINPQLADNSHPAYSLSTAGIIDYLFRVTPIKGVDIDLYIDLVAISLISDVMPLLGLNRWYVLNGLKAIKEQPRPAILDLCVVAKINHKQITGRDIAFGIAPRLNAAGRLGDPTPVVLTLLEEKKEKVCEYTANLERINTTRRKIVAQIQEDIEKQIQTLDNFEQNNSIILSGQFWHTGVIGINAAKLVSKYNKPAVVIGFDQDIAKGSARSMPGVNLYNILNECSDVLDHFGGHSQAAGFSLKPLNIAEFKRKFMAKSHEMIKENELKRQITIDADILLSNISLEFIDELSVLAPFGESNQEPIFFSNVRLIESKKVGQKKDHMKCRFEQNGIIVDAIGFNLANRFDEIKSQNVSIVFNISKNEFNGYITPQIKLIDIR